MGFDRTDRISEEIRKELALLIRGLKDPRIPEFTSVVAVEVTRDLRYAKAFISVLDNKSDKNDAILGLNSAAGFIRREIGKRVQLRYTPEFTFILDNSIEYGSHINSILSEIEKESGKE